MLGKEQIPVTEEGSNQTTYKEQNKQNKEREKSLNCL